MSRRFYSLLARIVLGISALAGAVILFLYNPSGTPWMPRCPTYAGLGVYCPGCGSLRATHHLLHGRLLTALEYNPLFVVALPLIGVLFFWEPVWARRPWFIWSCFGVLVLYGILRNIPVWPWSLLAPG
jgi:hypothetical protein